MTVEIEARLAITTEDTDVGSLRKGDLLHVAFPSPHVRVVSNESREHLLAPNRRSRVTLVDSDGIEKRFRLSPRRQVQRVTNPEIPVGPWRWEWGWPRDLSDDLRSWQRADAWWHKMLWPVARPFVRLWKEILSLRENEGVR